MKKIICNNCDKETPEDDAIEFRYRGWNNNDYHLCYKCAKRLLKLINKKML